MNYKKLQFTVYPFEIEAIIRGNVKNLSTQTDKELYDMSCKNQFGLILISETITKNYND